LPVSVRDLSAESLAAPPRASTCRATIWSRVSCAGAAGAARSRASAAAIMSSPGGRTQCGPLLRLIGAQISHFGAKMGARGSPMNGLMMEYPLTLTHIFDRARLYFSKTELVSRPPDKPIHRTTCGEFHARAQ